MNGIFSQGTFTNAQNVTPEQLKRKRATFARLLSKQPARTVGGGLADLATGIVGGISANRSNKIEGEKTKEANDLFSRITGFNGGFNGGQTSTFSILGQTPSVATDPQSDPQSIGNDTMAALGLPSNSPQIGKRDRIRNGLIGRGLPEHVADGFLANFQEESGLDAGINEINPTVPGSRGGFGLAQWTGPRRVALERFAAERGAPASDENTQLDFLMQELDGSESNAAQSILASQDANGAASTIASEFLRPAPENLQKRLAKFGGQQSNQPDMSALFQAASNPFLSQEQRQVVMSMIAQQQTAQAQANDPLRQLQIQNAQKTLDAPTKRETLEGADGFKRFIDTGERVFPDAQTPSPIEFNQLTPEEVTAAGLDPTKAWQRNVDGKITEIGGAGTNVNVTNDLRDQSEFDKVTGKKVAETTNAIVEAGDAAQRSLITIDRLQEALANSPQGGEGAITAMAGAFGVKTEGSSDLEHAQALISKLIPAQRPPGSGTMSDADLALFKKSLPAIINTPDGNRKIIETIRAIAEYDMQRGDIAAQVQFGEIKASEARKLYRKLTNPLAGIGKTATPPKKGVRRVFNPSTGKLE